jgi:hypothetical protein
MKIPLFKTKIIKILLINLILFFISIFYIYERPYFNKYNNELNKIYSGMLEKNCLKKINNNNITSINYKMVILNGRRYWNENISSTWSFFDYQIMKPNVKTTNLTKTCENNWQIKILNSYLNLLKYLTELNYKHIIIVEDDVSLINKSLFEKELNMVINSNIDFYSFYNSGDINCIYQYGTQAFYISNNFIKKFFNDLNNLPYYYICETPIDILFSEMYTLSKTFNNIVEHKNIGSTRNKYLYKININL